MLGQVRVLALTAGWLSTAIGFSAFAQVQPDDGDTPRLLEEIVVTAQKREQGLKDVPISIEVVDGETINQNAILELEDLSERVPSFTVTEAAISTLVYVRGLGSGINQGFEQSVGMYIDGVYAGRGRQYRSAFLDVERVELLKGPQGILFGKNTIAGAINITTAQPTDQFESYVTGLMDAEHGERELTAVVSGPLSDTVSGRLAAKTGSFDGWVYNSYADRDEPGVDNWIARGSLRWLASDRLEITGKFERSEYDVDGRSTQITRAFIYEPLYKAWDPAFEGEFNKKKSVGGIGLDNSKTHSTNAALTINYDWDEVTLTAISGYMEYDYLDQLDVDFGPIPYLFQTEPQKFKQYSQEIRLLSAPNDKFEYLAGIYLESAKLRNQKALDVDLTVIGSELPPATRFVGFDQDTDSWAVFGQGTWHLRDNLRFNVGLRYTSEDKTADQNLWFADFQTSVSSPELDALYSAAGLGTAHAYHKKRSENNFTPSVSLQWDSSENVTWYASSAQGFKAGGFNEAETTGDENNFEFKSEKSTTFELGAKSSLAGGAARLDAALFYTKFDDLQVSSFEGVSFVVGNAAQVTSKGIELEGQYWITDHFNIGGSWTYLDSTYDHFPNANCTIAQTVESGLGYACTQDLSGKVTQYAPRNSGRLDLTWETTTGAGQFWQAQFSVYHTDGYYIDQDLDRNTYQSSFQKYYLRLTWQSPQGHWSVSLLGKNLTDKLTKNHASDVPLLAGAFYSTTDRPRSVALQLSYIFQ